MTLRSALLATTLMAVAAAPALAQSSNLEVGTIAYEQSALNEAALKSTTSFPVNAADAQPATAPAQPVLSFADTGAAVTRSENAFSGAGRDWTGFYAGGQIGFANIDTDVTNSNDGFIGGIFLGYDYDFGNVVVGGSFDYDFTDISVTGTPIDVEEVFRIKGRVGGKIGEGLLYATAGYAHADTNLIGDDGGYFIGAGYERFITPNFTVGGEILYHDFNNFNSSGVDVDATTVQIRGAFRF